MKKFLFWALSICSMMTLASCTGGYSFTGASIPVDAKTISVKQFPNFASTVNPQLSQKLYEGMQQMFSSQTSLTVINDDGDLQISGEITDYSTRASALSSDDNVATNRLTVTIKVKFTNRFDEKADFEQTFSRFKDYNAALDLSAVEQGLVSEIVTELCEDVFNKSVVNW
ncbi:MAG: LPS assembly lipoprotein LptE [Bacteroidales bacterium]|nr:LPS assembly lipoprotein LptE [Bacteroidales bacterium]